MKIQIDTEFFLIEVGETGKQIARLYGFDRGDLDLAATHCFAGALMPALRNARANKALSRAQYKRAKTAIEQRMRENMQYDAGGRISLRDVRERIRAMS